MKRRLVVLPSMYNTQNVDVIGMQRGQCLKKEGNEATRQRGINYMLGSAQYAGTRENKMMNHPKCLSRVRLLPFRYPYRFFCSMLDEAVVVVPTVRPLCSTLDEGVGAV